LLGKVGSVLFATDGCGDVHNIAVAIALVLVLNGMNYIRVPEDGVARLHERNGCQTFEKKGMPFRLNGESTSRFGATQSCLGDIVLQSS